MPPKKKHSSSTSKKSNQNNQPQPSKFGIQHFFERHTQNARLASQNPKIASDLSCASAPDDVVSAPSDSKSVSILNSQNPPKIFTSGGAVVAPKDSDSIKQNTINRVDSGPVGPAKAVSPSEVPRNGSKEANNTWQNTPPENLVKTGLKAEVNFCEMSPDNLKSLPIKRFKFSPGMFIKQSQDDGVDEITWKISPVNERLQAVSQHLPEIFRALADSSGIKSLQLQRCSKKKISPGTAGKVEKWLASPTPKAAERSLVSMNRIGLESVSPDQDMEIDTNATNMTNSGVDSRHSPFRTPPSLSYCSDKVHPDVTCKGASDQLCLRQHKKALLELLDQVEDAISTEDSIDSDNGAHSSKVQDGSTDQMPVKAGNAVERTETTMSEKFIAASSNCHFLVLEVSEKHKPADSSAAQCPYKVLRVLNEQSGEERAVYLWEEWLYSVIAPGDTVNIIGQFDEQGKCDVDHDKNFIIVHPDILLSGTRVSASFNCSRRTVFDERLKFSEHSTSALIGTLLHQVFQAGLMKGIPTINFLKEYAQMILQKNIESLYACGVNENDVQKTLIEAVPKLLNWIRLFRDSQETEAPYADFGFNNGLKKVDISEVIDIEEMAWAPKYGLKGMIDASVRVKVQTRKIEAEEKIMPLEFKTGKVPNSQLSVEHRAQVMLYTLLMSERYQKNIDSGLLYYLQSDQTQGITVQRSDLIGLIMRRNELANDILKASTTQQLPPMLQSPSMCKGCRHLDVCTIYHKAHDGSTESSGLGDMFDSHTNHLTSSHSLFLRHWDRLIDLEAKEIEFVKKGIWCSHLKSQTCSSSLSSIVLDGSDGNPHWKSHKDNRFIYRFVHQDLHSLGDAPDKDVSGASSPVNDLDLTLRSGDYVILSTESSHQAVASGVIMDISHNHVSVSFSKRLRLPASSANTQDLLHQVWRIDKDEFMTSFAIMRFNLVQLFLQNAQSNHLLKMIVDLEAPRFDSGCIVSQDPAISYVWSEKSLNDDQRRAILKILTAKDYALILGMPGTGKTSTMVHAVKALLIRGASILLTSYTNSAVDNLLIKLRSQGIDFLRIGRQEAVHEEVRGHCFSAMNIQSVEDIKIRLEQVKVVAVTCLGITSPVLANMRFDVCIMDEAGQTTLPVSLGPLTLASTFVLVGDHYQLPPLVQSTEARENGMGISLFCRLSEAHPHSISALQSQYRMCQDIMELSNALIYGDRLRCGSPEIANAQLKLSCLKNCSSWLKEALNPRRPVIFIDTDKLAAFEAKDHNVVNNPIEASIIAKIAVELVNCGVEGEQIGVITPYNSQANLIRNAIHVASLEIHTIDKYQGRDKDCILVSFVRSSENPRCCTSSLLGDWHRINVALTRAKKKLIMVGSCITLSKVPLLKLLIKKIGEQSEILSVSKTDISLNGELKRCSQFR